MSIPANLNRVDSWQPSGPARPFPLFQRFAGLASLFTLEILFLSIWLDTGSLQRTVGLTGAVGSWGPAAVRSLMVMALILAGFCCSKSTELRQIFDGCAGTGMGRRFLAGHFLAMAAFCALSAYLFAAAQDGPRVDLVTSAWLVCGGLGAALGVGAFLPLGACWRLARGMGGVWVYAAAAGAVANPLARAVDRLWNPAAGLTFELARLWLRPFVHDLVSNPAARVLGTRHFRVLISPQCSGLEGAGLMLLFGAFWLWLLRDELRFPRALLLIPAGIAILFVLNSVRLAALIAIGNAGARGVATGGFHSQAGWIAFTAVALGLVMGTPHVPWLTRTRPSGVRPVGEENPAAPYLVPFLAILAAAMIARAASGRFEWLYPLRLVAAGAALWIYRRRLRHLDWRAGRPALAIGAAAFAVWLLLHGLAGVQPENGIAAGLGAAGPAAGALWLLLRTLAAVVTVPVAEELAFRGFLIPWLISHFQTAGIRGAMPLSILVSSAAFGAMHGGHWLAGTAAGFLYAAAFLGRRRIGDAAVAHATTNALLAGWVMATRDWSFW